MNDSIVIVAAKRTPIGTLQGALKSLTANELGAIAARAAIAEAGVDAAKIDHVVVGNVLQSSSDAIYCARHVGLHAGVPIETPALTLNRLCGSGFEAVVEACRQLMIGEATLVLAGGTENMSQAPHVLRGGRDGWAFGRSPQVEDSLAAALTDSYCKAPMGMTAEKLAESHGITRADCDAHAKLSQDRYAAAHAAGVFAREITPVEITTKKGVTIVDKDEHPRATTPEVLGKLAPVFKKDGVVTAGNASGINDGAAMLVLCKESYARDNGLKPLAKILSWGIAGVDPTIMGIGPVPAIRAALGKAKLSLADMDLVEVNEAFAAQYLAVEKELGLDGTKTNVNGGAIAIGHPLGASGARITTHLVHELGRTGKRYAVGSACIGGGQGVAIVLERMS